MDMQTDSKATRQLLNNKPRNFKATTNPAIPPPRNNKPSGPDRALEETIDMKTDIKVLQSFSTSNDFNECGKVQK